MAKKILFLQLSPEFGSTKFGPFQGAEVRLGSDPGRSDISLPENLGVSPEHAKLVKQQDETFIISPVDRTSQVFVHRKDGRPGKQITAPIALTDGDGFSLVAADGPKFIIVLEHPKQAAKADDGPKGGIGKAAQRLSAKSLMGEIKRIGFAKAIASSTGNGLMKAWTFIKSGAFLQPRYIILGMFLLSGYLFAGTLSCGAAGLGLSLANTQEELQAVKDQCGVDEEDDGRGPTINKEVEKILGKAGAGKELRSLLEKDAKFATAFKGKLSAIKQNASAYEWVKDKKGNKLVEWQKVLANSSAYDEPLVRVFTYLAAPEGDWSNFDKYRIYNTPTEAPDMTCYRGPLLLSWRQGKRMGLTNVFLDLPVDFEKASQLPRDILEPEMEAYSAKIGADNKVDLQDGDVIIADTRRQIDDTTQCVYVDGPDDRDNDLKAMPNAVKSVIGKSAKGLPASGGGNYTLSRALRWYGMDQERGFGEFDKSLTDKNKTISSLLEANNSLTKDGKEELMDQVAELYARAALVPCLGVMGNDEAPDWMKADAAMKEDSKIECAIFLFLIDEEASK